MIELAEAFKAGFDPLAWKIIPDINIGSLAISPHGIGIAVGYLAGAQLMVRRSRRLGGPDENDIWNTLFWALIGAMIGARLGYVFGHIPEVTDNGDDILGIFKVWEGGISLLGGITGAVLVALPYMVKHKMGFWRTIDLATPGLALGIVIGRIGDLVIGDHLGKPTDFVLGWRCLGSESNPPIAADTYRALLDRGDPPSLGCYDLALHQTALYDFFSTGLLLVTLLWLGRKTRNTGFMTLVFVIWYGAMRVITDFLRVDQRYLGLTGSQILALLVGITAIYFLVRYRGAPPRFAGPPTDPSEPPPAEGDTEAPEGAETEPGGPEREEPAAATTESDQTEQS